MKLDNLLNIDRKAEIKIKKGGGALKSSSFNQQRIQKIWLGFGKWMCPRNFQHLSLLNILFMLKYFYFINDRNKKKSIFFFFLNYLPHFFFIIPGHESIFAPPSSRENLTIVLKSFWEPTRALRKFYPWPHIHLSSPSLKKYAFCHLQHLWVLWVNTIISNIYNTFQLSLYHNQNKNLYPTNWKMTIFIYI